MKSYWKKTFAFLLVLVFFISTYFLAEGTVMTESAIKADAAIIASNSLSITKKVDNGAEITIIDNIQSFKNKLNYKYNNLSELQTAKLIYQSIEEEDDVIERLSEEQLLEALNFTSTVQKTNYIKYTQEDGQSYMTKQELIDSLIADPSRITDDGKQFLEDNNVELTVDIESGESSIMPLNSSITTSSDGYLRLTTTTTKTTGAVSGRTYYLVSAFASWLLVPTFLRQDVLAISSNATYDNDYNNYGYFYENVDEYVGSNSTDPDNLYAQHVVNNYIYKDTGSNNSEEISFEYTAGVAGIALRFDMYEGVFAGDTAHNFVYHNIQAYLQYKVSLYNVDGGVQAGYGHKQFSLNEISVSLAPLSISFSVFGWMAKYYGETVSIYY